MCPPVSMRCEAEGLSYLYTSWMYQLQHGSQLRVCFACFKAAFLDLGQLLDLEDWEDEDWDSELMDHTEAGSEQGSSPGMGPSWGLGHGQLAQGGFVDWGWGTLASGLVGSEEEGLDEDSVPTELEPQDATPLGLGAEDADWTQSLPWRFGGLPTCSHWPSPSPWQEFFKVDLPPVTFMVGCYDAIYFRKMKPGWALRTPDRCWKLLLEPDEVRVVRLQDAPQKHR
ncbi:testis-expressed protein 19 [Phocoena sinus]|nr:testis-expressed protein 19 [Phocoena sinus]